MTSNNIQELALPLKYRTYITVVCVGFAATIAQIVLMRELVVSFYGNEISLGLILGGWLFWTGAGSLLFGQLVDRWQLGVRALILLLALLALLLPLTVIGARLIRLVLGTSGPGEIVALETIVWSSLALLGPICLVNGSLFSLICRLASSEGDSSTSVGNVYLMESIGAVTGGVIFTFALVHLGSSLLAGLIASCLLALISLAICSAAKRSRNTLKSISAALFVVCAVLAVFAADIDRWSAQILWRPFGVKDTTDTPYGRLTFLEHGGQKTILANGLITASRPPGPEAEDMVHFALLSAQDAERVLVIGGALSGALPEVLKHPVESVDFVELDSGLIEGAREAFPEWTNSQIERPKLNLISQDGREVVKSASAKELYDVIIIDLPPPYTAQLNRFYTTEFFRSVAQALSRSGLLAFRVPSSETYISPLLAEFLSSIALSARIECLECENNAPIEPAAGSEHLFNVAIVPGSTNIFLCSRGAMPTLDSERFESRLEELDIDTGFFAANLKDRLRKEKILYLVSILDSAPETLANTDLRPTCYFYDAVLWSSLFRLHGAGGEAGAFGAGRLLLNLRKVNAWWLVIGGGIITFVLLLLGRKSSCVRRSFLIIAVCSTGFAEITAEVLCLIGFQIAYGTVYYLVGGIVASYMAGLSIGSYVMTRSMRRWGMRMLINVQIAVAVYMIVIAVAVGLVVTSSWTAPGWGMWLFVVLTLGAGFLGGFQFPLAAKVFLGDSRRTGERAGAIYGADLIGSCVGAMLAGAIMIPLLGIVGTAFAAGGLVGLSAILLASSRR